MSTRSRPPTSSTPPAGPSPLSRVAIEVRESISLRTDDGLFFGDLLRFGGGRIEVETDGRFELRAEVEFQLKLPGFNTTVYGVSRVLRAISRTALLRQYTLRILRMRDADRISLQRWVDYTARGQSTLQAGTAEQPYDPTLDPNPWGIQSLDAAVQTQAGRVALRDAMRARFAPSSAGAPSAPPKAASPQARPSAGATPAPVGSSGSGAGLPPPADLGRAGIGAAIGRYETSEGSARAADQHRRRGEPDCSDRQGRAEAPVQPASWRALKRERRRPPLVEVEGARNPKLPNPKDPQVHVRLSANPPQVFVRYHTRSGYFSDWQSYLSKNVLFLQNTEETPKKGSSVQLNIFLPAGLSVTCTALVIATLPTGFGLNLLLDAEGRLTLSSASKI